MKYANVCIRTMPIALVMVSEEDFADDMMVKPEDFQKRLQSWVFLVMEGFSKVGHPAYGKCRAGNEALRLNPGAVLFEILMLDNLEWQELAEEELPF